MKTFGIIAALMVIFTIFRIRSVRKKRILKTCLPDKSAEPEIQVKNLSEMPIGEDIIFMDNNGPFLLAQFMSDYRDGGGVKYPRFILIPNNGDKTEWKKGQQYAIKRDKNGKVFLEQISDYDDFIIIIKN